MAHLIKDSEAGGRQKPFLAQQEVSALESQFSGGGVLMVNPELLKNTKICGQPMESNFIIEEESSEAASNSTSQSMHQVKDLKITQFFSSSEIISKLETKQKKYWKDCRESSCGRLGKREKPEIDSTKLSSKALTPRSKI